jgi:F420H(2)-dependent quinone reductase
MKATPFNQNGSGTEKFRARAGVVENRQERDRLFAAMCLIWPSCADYEKRTERLIPVVILEGGQE